MKRAFIIMGLCALVALAATSCKKEAQTTSSLKATLTQPTSDAKTHLSSDSYLYWNEGDAIKVFDAQGNEYQFSTDNNNVTTATFTGNDAIDVNGSYTAFYPAANAEKDGDYVRLSLSNLQQYDVNSFANGTYPMAAVYNATSGFTFSSPCGLLALQVKGSGSIGSIVLSSKLTTDKLAGDLKYGLDGTYQNEILDPQYEVTLNCGGVELSSTATTFYFALPAGVFTNGFTAVLKDIMGGELGTLSTINNNQIEAQTIRLMDPVTVGQTGVTFNVETPQASTINPSLCTLTGSVTYDPGVVLDEVGFYYGEAAKGQKDLPANLTHKVTLDYIPASGVAFSYTLTGLAENKAYQYCMYVKTGDNETYGALQNFSTPTFNPYTAPLTCEAKQDNVTVAIYDPSEVNLEYSTDGGATWNTYESEITLAHAGDMVSFRGNNAKFNDKRILCYSPCYVYGNVMSLLDATNFATANTVTSSAFLSLFWDDYSSNQIYSHSTKDLVLPATNLANNCYNRMFKDCAYLTKAPTLPATTLAKGCYYKMFEGCSDLTAAPALPAPTLAEECYQYMFYGCSSLTTAPALPAETLANYCYSNMFENCSNLTTAPALPATTLVSNCYSAMFRYCSNLNSVTCLATSGINQNNSTLNWLYGVASSGTFTKASGANVSTTTNGSGSTWPRSNRGIPSGWTVETDYKFSVSPTKTVRFAPGNLLNTGYFADNQYDYGGLLEWAASFTTNYSGDWRALTSDEWNYLFTDRANASNLWGFANVVDSNSNGIILLPDGSSLSINTDHSAWSDNTIDETTWQEMEANGAVFLPAAGYLDGGSPEDNGKKGYYWCSTSGEYMSFGKSGSSFEVPTCYVGGGGRRSVRLVINVQ